MCTKEQIELFSCILTSRDTIALCLDKKKLTTELVRDNSSDTQTEMPISDVKQIIAVNAHGDNTLFWGNIPDGMISLYINHDYTDDAEPAIYTKTSDSERNESCSDWKYVNQPESTITVKGKSESVDILSLPKFGISQLEDSDEWSDIPNMRDRDAPQSETDVSGNSDD